uniref:uncharacterized protein LOC120343948 n=1 Tax=Styela clava TaxID=7725 RepID=UPI0019397F3A|nr:uncharacterized protein LOC120343948 [Styela clava]
MGEIGDVLRAQQSILSKKAQAYSKVFQNKGTSEEKRIKVIHALLYDVIAENKNRSGTNISKIVLTCVRYLIQNWKIIEDTKAIQLDVLINGAFKRALEVKEDNEYIKQLVDCIQDLIPLPGGCSKKVSDWIAYKLKNFYKNDIKCRCPKDCEVVKCFEMELLSLCISSSSGSTSEFELISNVMITSEKHLSRSNFSDSHVKCVANTSMNFLLNSKISENNKSSSQFQTLLKMIENIILLNNGKNEQSERRISEHMENIETSVSTLQSLNKKSEQSDTNGHTKVYLAIFKCYLTMVTNIEGKINGSLKNIVKCINMFSNLTNDTKSLEVLNKVVNFYYFAFKITTTDCMKMILEDLNVLLERNVEILSLKDNILDSVLYFLEIVMRICAAGINFKGTDNFDSSVETVAQNLFNCIFEYKFEDSGKTSALFTNVAIVLVKVKRKLLKNLSAMKIVEKSLVKVQYSVAKPLISHWVKAKLRESNCLDGKKLEQFKKRTILHEIKNSISKQSMEEILLAELEIYRSINNTEMEQLSVINTISNQCHLQMRRKALLSCNKIELEYELGECSEHNFKTIYPLCKPDSETWECYVQVKLIEFMEMWSKAVQNSSDKSLYINTQILNEIVLLCEKAAEEKYPFSMHEKTFKAIHKVSALFQLFQKPIMNVRLMTACHVFLSDCNETEETIVTLWNNCSVLCELGFGYLALRQVKLAEKYSKLASVAFNKYIDYIDGCSDSETGSKARNTLFTKFKILLAEINCALGNDVEAQEVIDGCMKEDFLSLEVIQRSITALFCSVQAMSSNCKILGPDSTEMRISKLLATSRRIASLKVSILPNLHTVQSKSGSEEGIIFDIKPNEGYYDPFIQLSAMNYFFENLYNVSEAYLIMGDPKMANGYCQIGLVHSKYLCLKNWYASFCVVKLQIASLSQDEENFPQLCKYFCQVNECECTSDKSVLDDSVLQCENDDYDDIGKDINEVRDVEHDMVGSTDDDAIQFSTPALDIDCYQNPTTDLSASPSVVKRKKLKLLPMPKLFLQKKVKSCSCEPHFNFQSIKMQLDYVNTIAEYYARSNALEAGFEVCKKIFKAISNLDTRSNLIPLMDDVELNEFFLPQVASSHVVNSKLHLLKLNIEESLSSCNEATKSLDLDNFTDINYFIIKSRIKFQHSCIAGPKSSSKNVSIDSALLNAIIDGLSKCHISSTEETEVHTPVMERRRKKVPTTKKAKPGSVPARANRATSSRTKKKEPSKNFKIFTEKNEKENKLPVPEYITSRSPSPCSKNVYEFMSSGDDKKTPKKSLKNSQNIMQARKAATRRHRKQFGNIYSDDDKERVRGRIGKPSVARSFTKPGKGKQILNEVPYSNYSTGIMLTYLLDALSSANVVSDFLTMKLCAQAISACHHVSAKESERVQDIIKATAFHLFSVGVTTRSAMHLYAKTIKNVPCLSKKCVPTCTCVHKLMKETSPGHALKSCTTDSDGYINSITDLLPTDWTICVISLSQQSGGSKLLLSRLRHGIAPLHIQTDGTYLEEILEKFSDLMVRNTAALKSRDRNYWWTQRRNFNTELGSILDTLGTKALGCNIGILCGKLVDEAVANKFYDTVNDIIEKFNVPKYKEQNIEVLLNSWGFLTAEQKLQGIIDVCGNTTTTKNISAISSALETSSSDLDLNNQSRHHVILILDKDVQLLPWEVTVQLQGESVTRLPSADLLKLQLHLLNSAENNVAKKGVNLKDVSYILNPNGDLVKSEERYKDWFQGMKSWKGIVSREPRQKEWISSITEFDLFIFCGHGSGTKYVSSTDFRNIKTRAAALLMGCGSAKLDQPGVFEPGGIVINYLMTGSPCILGCLWKVTDKDIDMFLCKLLENWADGKKEMMPRCTDKARKALKMPHINGAACVIYGLPIHCQLTIAKFLKSIPKEFLSSS